MAKSPARKSKVRPRTANAVPKKTKVGASAAGDAKGTKGTKSKGRVEWGRINVFVRGRPLSKKELEAGAFDSLEIADKNTTFLHEFCASDDYLRMKRLKTRQYQFDHVFNMFDSQKCVYETTAAPLVDSVLKGQNASCFCYGATGTGKTRTMLGSVDDPGIMVLAFQNLFAAIDAAIGKESFKVVLLLRLSPLLPFALSNYLYGLTSVDLGPYVLGSWLGMLPGTFAYVSAGDVGKVVLGKAQEAGAGGGGLGATLESTWPLLLGVGGTILATTFLSRVVLKSLKDLEEAPSE